MNPKLTAEDNNPHIGALAVIEGKQPGHILLQKHNKLKFWTIPGGKGPVGSDPKDVVRKEVREECSIDLHDLDHIGLVNIPVEREGKRFSIPTHVFHAKTYTGEPVNTEPEKHEVQDFKDPQALVLAGEPISKALELWLKHKRKSK